MEPEPASAARAKSRLQKVLIGLFDAVADEIPRGYFDLVVCNDVIEHLNNPEDFLAAIRERMTPGGTAITQFCQFAVRARLGPDEPPAMPRCQRTPTSLSPVPHWLIGYSRSTKNPAC